MNSQSLSLLPAPVSLCAHQMRRLYALMSVCVCVCVCVALSSMYTGDVSHMPSVEHPFTVVFPVLVMDWSLPIPTLAPISPRSVVQSAHLWDTWLKLEGL